ncbi:MAG: hypothetical protein ACRD15_07670 [Vicinamibacterales bacterium]
MIWLLTLALTGPGHATGAGHEGARSLAPAPRAIAVEEMLTAESRRIRSGSARITTLLADGVRRSKTFADLVTKIHQTNVIIYIEQSFGLPPDMNGRILLQTFAGNQRYLRIQVRVPLQSDQTIAVIAHELHHALEVADDPAVVDEAGLVELYLRIGHRSHGVDGYDTEAARAAGQLVRRELIG